VAVAGLILAPSGFAATFTVDSSADDPDAATDGVCSTSGGSCTLRAAMEEANANDPQPDQILFAPMGTTIITLTNGPLPVIVDDVTITGFGASETLIDGVFLGRIFAAQADTTTTISGLTIENGQAFSSGAGSFASAGGVLSSGDMTLDRVVIDSNHASASAPADSTAEALGGGLYVASGTMTLTRSTVSNNSVASDASGTGQAAANGGGIAVENGATLHVVRSTIATNHVGAQISSGTGSSATNANGGGIYTRGAVTIDQSTITNNTVQVTGGTEPSISDFASGGGVFEHNLGSLSLTGATVSSNSLNATGVSPSAQGANMGITGTATFRSTIVADPISTPGAENCIGGTLTSNGYNLEDDAGQSCGFSQATDIAGQDPVLGTLANNGGPTQTMNLPAGSPAIDKGRSFGATADQRGAGFPRISDSPTIANASGGNGADIGAFERDVVAPHAPAILASVPKTPANNNSPKLKGLAEAGSLVRIYKTAGCTGSAVKAGSAAAFSSPGLAVSVPDNSTTTFRATATDASNNTSACSAGFTYVEDSAPPNTTITSATISRAKHRAVFSFSSNEAGARFQCKLDGQAYANCTTPKGYTGLANGSHTFRVRAIDRAGNVDPTPAARSFTI
jgi:CSLREA domain-containing protein